MKLFISLLFIHSVYARDIFLIENKSNRINSSLVKNILNKKFNIPLNLIAVRDIHESCRKNAESIVQFCIEENDEIKVIYINQYLIRNSFNFLKLNSEEKI